MQAAAASSESEAGKIVEEWAQAHADLSAQLQEAETAREAALQERQAVLDERAGWQEQIRAAQADTEAIRAVGDDRLQAMEHAQQAVDAMEADMKRLQERTAAAEASAAAASGAEEVAALLQQLRDTEAERAELQKELEGIVPELEGVLADRSHLQERVEALHASEAQAQARAKALEQETAQRPPGAEMELVSVRRQLDGTSAENDGLRQERGALQVGSLLPWFPCTLLVCVRMSCKYMHELEYNCPVVKLVRVSSGERLCAHFYVCLSMCAAGR